MKNSKKIALKKLISNISFFIILTLTFSCNDNSNKDQKKATSTTEETKESTNILWSVKAISPEGESFDVKAEDANGKLFSINAIQDSDQNSFMDIKAFVGNKKLPVKILVSKKEYSPIKAIDKKGNTYSIKAISSEGEKLDIKGVIRFGNVVAIKAINKNGDFYGVKAISPDGKLNDILGIKINLKDREMSLSGYEIYAHLKAMHQSMDIPISKETAKKEAKKRKQKKVKLNEETNIIWNVKAITLEGKNLNIKAFDSLGNNYDVKAIQDSKQHSFMNIKAFVKGSQLPIKVIKENGEYSPIKAIDQNGDFYDLKAITKDGKTYRIMGVSRSGNIINIKAITDDGSFYAVKAFSPKGELNDIKGIKIFDRPIELTMRGAKVYGHLKAIKQ